MIDTLSDSKPYSDRGKDHPATETESLADFLDDDHYCVWIDGKYKVYHWDKELGYLEDLVKNK